LLAYLLNINADWLVFVPPCIAVGKSVSSIQLSKRAYLNQVCSN